jgi:hypothetical protein
MPWSALLAAAALGLVALLLSDRIAPEMADLQVYWRAAARAAQAQPLYRVEDQHYQFKYLPAFAVLAMPLGSLPFPAARTIWLTVSAVLLVALIAASIVLLPDRRKPAWLLVVATIVAMGKFYGHELVLGQVNLLFALVVVAALHAMRREREATAGALLALAMVVKPYAVIFLPWLAARRRIPALAAAAGGLLAALALPAALYGAQGAIDLHRAWWHTVTASTAPNLLNADNVSIAAMYAKWIGAGGLAAALATVTSANVLLAIAVAFSRRNGVPFPEGLEGALLLTCIPMISPQGWDYVFLISTPAIVYLVNYEDRLPPLMRAAALAAVAVIGLSIFDVMGRTAYAHFMALSIISICYFVVLAALCTLRLRRVA